MVHLSSQLNLMKRNEATQKYLQNKQKILTFLGQEKFSTSQILQTLLGLKARSPTCKLLRKMVNDGVLKRHQFTPTIILWGITFQGLCEIENVDMDAFDSHVFEPSKVNILTLEHTLSSQQVHAECVRLGLGYVAGRTLGSRADSSKVPDGIILINEHRIALEIERHVKSKRRYDSIIYNYLKAIKAGKYQHVLYVMPDTKVAQKIKNAILNLGSITMRVNGHVKRLTLKPEIHLSYFDFIVHKKVQGYLKDVKHQLCNSSKPANKIMQ